MSSLPRQSKKRIAAIKSGSLRTQGNSSFLQMTAAEFRAYNTKRNAQPRSKGGKPMKQKSERQKAEDRAWTPFSRFIRMRDANEQGICRCCTCGRYKHWKRMQAGHYVTRAKDATLFLEINSHAQCPGCNRHQGGKPVEYELFLEAKYGEGTAAEIRKASVNPLWRRRTIRELEDVQAEYTIKADALEAEKFAA